MCIKIESEFATNAPARVNSESTLNQHTIPNNFSAGNSCTGKNCPSFLNAIKPFEPKSKCLVDVDTEFADLQTQTTKITSDIDKKLKTLLNRSTTRQNRPKGLAAGDQCPSCFMSSLAELGVSRDECDKTQEYERCWYEEQTCGSGKMEPFSAES